MLDEDLAALYKVETKQLKRAVKRNINRFPEDFMFELTSQEDDFLRCQFGTTLYGVETKVLNQQVKRNIDRFPEESFNYLI